MFDENEPELVVGGPLQAAMVGVAEIKLAAN